MPSGVTRTALSRDIEVWSVLFAIVLANFAFIYAINDGLIRHGYYYHGRFLVLGLALAAAVFLFRGWKAPFELLKPLTVRGFNLLWFPFVILWPQFVAALLVIAKGLMLGTGFAELQKATMAVALDPKVLPTVVIGAFVGEIVWVGYAIARLGRSTTTLIASLIVGLFWAAWWAPMVVMNIGVIPGIPVWALFVAQTAIAVMCGFVYAHTRSGWVVLALQISANSAFLIFPVSPETGGVASFVAFGALYGLMSLLLHLRFGPRPLLRDERPLAVAG
jgi:membrane protease YdiL (CAAX protease family)